MPTGANWMAKCALQIAPLTFRRTWPEQFGAQVANREMPGYNEPAGAAT
jgi:hypothetical protein